MAKKLVKPTIHHVPNRKITVSKTARKARQNPYLGLDAEWLDDGKVKVNYGLGMGWEVFDSEEAMVARCLPWVAREMQRLSKQLSDMSRFQNLILGVITK